MAVGAWDHKFPVAKDVHPTYIDYANPGWDTVIASWFHHIFTALDAIQDALGYDVTGAFDTVHARITDLEARVTALEP